MDVAIAQQFLEEVNTKADPAEVLRRIGYATDKIQVVGDAIKAFCPIHKDKKFRSLLVESGKQSFKCTLKTCAGSQGGTVVDLYALSKKIEPLLAAAELVGALDLKVDPEWTSRLAGAMLEDAQQAFVRRDTEQAEAAARQALKFQPQLAEARLLLATIHADRGETGQAVDEYATLVEGYLSDEHYDEADRTLEGALAAFPDSEDLLFLQVRSAELQSRNDQAIALLKQVVERREVSNRHVDNLGVLQKLVELDPEDSTVHIKISHIFELRHDMRNAGRSLEKAAKLLQKQGRNAEAIPLLEKVVKLEPEMKRTRLDLAEELIRDGDFPRAKEQIFELANQQIENQEYGPAQKTLERWLEIEPESVEVHESLARIFQDQDRNAEAGVELAEAARLALKDGEKERAQQFLFRVKFISPEKLDVRQQIIELFEQDNQPERAGFELLDLAEVLFAQGSDEEAEKALKRAAGISDSSSVKHQVADALQSHGRTEAAAQMLHDLLESCEKSGDKNGVALACGSLLKLRPDDVELAFRRTSCLWSSDAERATEEAAQLVVRLREAGDNERALELVRLGAAHVQDFSDESLALLRTALELGEAEAAGKYYSVVIEGYAEYDPDNALVLARDMAALDPNHPSALSDYGVLCANAGLQEESAAAYFRLAQREYKAENLEAALQALEDALSQNAEHLGAQELRARLMVQMHGENTALEYFDAYLGVVRHAGDPTELRKALEVYTEHYPSDLNAQHETATLLAEAGQPDEAFRRFIAIADSPEVAAEEAILVSALQKAAELAPGEAGIHERLGLTLQQQGEPASAGASLLKAAELFASATDTTAAVRTASAAADLITEPLPALELLYKLHSTAKDKSLLVGVLPRYITALRGAGRIHLALERTTQLLKLDPGKLEHERLVADLHAENGDTDDAILEYTRLAEEYEKRQDYENALSVHAEMAQLRAPDLKTLQRLVGLAEKAGPEAAAAAKLQLGNALLASGDVLGAFDTARTLGSEKTGLLAGARLLQRIGEAAGTQEQALEAYLSAAQGYGQLKGEAGRKVDCLNAALALDPENDTAHQLLAEHFESAGEPDFAFAHRVALLPLTVRANKEKSWKTEFAKLQQVAGDDPSKHLELGRRVLRAERVGEALIQFERAAELAAARDEQHTIIEAADAAEGVVFSSAKLCSAKLNALIALEDQQAAAAWLRDCAQHALRAEKGDEAQEHAERWIELSPEDPDALELLAAAFQKQSRTQKAVETYLSLATLLKAGGDYERAVAILRQSLAIDTEDVAARQLLWQVLLDAERQSEALAEMQQLADLLIEKHAYRDASTLLSRILDYHTNSEETLERLASLVHEHEGFGKASQYFRKLLQLRRASLPADEMAAEYERVLNLEGSEIDIRVEYAEFLEQQALLPDAKQQYVHIAQVYRDELNEPARAVEYLRKSVELLALPGDARVFTEMASLEQAAGNAAAAVAALRSAASLYSQSGEGKKAVQAIRTALELPLDESRLIDEAVLAQALAASGEKKKGREAFEKAFNTATSVDADVSLTDRQQVLLTLLQIDPLHVESALAAIQIADSENVATLLRTIIAPFREAKRGEDETRILKTARGVAPQDAEIRRELIESYRSRGEDLKLQSELADFARASIDQGQIDVAREVMVELAALPPSPQLMLHLAGLHMQLEENSEAVANYCTAAELLDAEGKDDDAVDALRKALEIEANAVPSALVATLARKGNAEIRKTAREILEAALIARTRTRSLVLATALLERETPEEAKRLLSLVFMRAGAGFLTAIGGAHADWLLESARNEDAAAVTQFICELSPNSPDVWWLASQLKKRYGDKAGSAEAALKAAQLYNEAGAVTEEESCYREVLEDIPEDAATLQTLAFFYEREKRADEGVEVMRRLAVIAENNNDATGAIHWLRKAVELNPAHLAVREHYANLLTTSGKAEVALEQWLEIARRSIKESQPERAEAAYEQVLVLEPENEHAVSYLLDVATKAKNEERVGQLSLVLAQVKAESGAVIQACQLLKNMLKKDADNLEALEKLSAFTLLAHDYEGHKDAATRLGNKLLKRGENVAAIEQFESALEYDPKNQDLLQRLIDCCAAEGMTERGSGFAMRLLEIAKEAGNPEQVRQAASTILDYDEQQTVARRELAEALLCLNRIPEAVAEWSRAAEQFQANKANQDALDCYRRIVQIAPSNFLAWRKLGDLSLTTGDSDAARGAYLHLLEAYSEAGESDKADAMISRMLQLDPDDIELHQQALAAYRRAGRNEHAMEQILWLVRHSIKSGDQAEAERLLELGMSIAPDSLALQQCQLELIRKLGRTDELQLRLRQLADQYIGAKNYAKAAEVLEQISEADPDNLEVRRELGTLQMQLENTSQAIGEYCHVIRELIKRQETEEARSTADALAVKYPKSLELRARIAEVFSQNGMADVGSRHFLTCAELASSNDDALAEIHFLRLAVEARPRWAEGYEKLAAAALKSGETEAAFSAYGNLAELLTESKKFPQAVTALRQQIKLAPNEPDPLLALAELYDRTGDRDKQVASLQELAHLYVDRGMMDEAVDTQKRLTILRPDDPEILQRYIELFAQFGNELEIIDDYIRLAEAHAARGEIEEAARTFEQVAAIDRKNPEVHEKFAAFLMASGQKGRAIAEMRKLADIYQAKSEPDSAVEILHAALALDSSNAELCLSLAIAQQNAGMREEANASYARATSILGGTAVMKGVDILRKLLDRDPENTELRRRLYDQLLRAGEKADAAKQARMLAESYATNGQLDEAEEAYRLAGELEPESSATIKKAIAQTGNDTMRQYLQYVRYGDSLFEEGDIDRALDAYRNARSLNDERPQLIQKCIDCMTLIAPEAEAISDYIALAERHMIRGEAGSARKVYEHVMRLDPFNADARSGLATAIQEEDAPKSISSESTRQDRQVLGKRDRKKRIGLDELLNACHDAAKVEHGTNF